MYKKILAITEDVCYNKTKELKWRTNGGNRGGARYENEILEIENSKGGAPDAQDRFRIGTKATHEY